MKWEYQGMWLRIVVEIFRPLSEIRRYRVGGCAGGNIRRRLARRIGRRLCEAGPGDSS